METVQGFQPEIKFDGSEKNLSLLKPEGLLERVYKPIKKSQEHAGRQNEALWLQTLHSEISQETQPETEDGQLKKQMNEIMAKLVDAKTQYGDYCSTFGIGETKAVLLTTPIRHVGEAFPDPTGLGGEEAKHIDHTYVLATEKGFFGLKFDKTVALIIPRIKEGVDPLSQPRQLDSYESEIPGFQEELEARRLKWHKENIDIVGTNTLDELYGPFSERALAYAAQQHCWKNEKSHQEVSKQFLIEDRKQKGIPGEPTQEEIDAYARNMMEWENTGLTTDKRVGFIFQIGSFQLYGEKLQPLTDQQIIQDAIKVSRENAQKPRVEPITDVRQQLQTAQTILSVI